MTVLATVAIATAVNVLRCMARAAVLRSFFVTLTGVAKFTTDLVVLATQRKFRRVVIEPRITPGSLFVAIAALFAEFSTMLVVVAMAIYATPGRRAVFVLRLMACGAVGLPVRAPQFEIRYRVIEGAGVQQHDVGRSAQMFAVTLFAGPVPNCRRFPMEPRLLRDIPCNVAMVVATQALSRLVVLLRSIVTLPTVLFDSRVRIGELARHQQFFERERVGIGSYNGDCHRS